MFHDPRRFPFAAVLEREWRAIHDEYAAVRDALVDWHETRLYEGGGWKVFPIFGFPHGEPLPDRVSRCSLTARLVQQHVPRHGAAGFSVLLPHTRVKPHEGYQGEYLRCHLGLAVPGGDGGLRVAGETRAWREGAALVFDDRVTHEAWNDTPFERVVLLVDFVPDG